jgi:hypothetical protein
MNEEYVNKMFDMLQNTIAQTEGHLYMLQPGDGTRYVMALHPLDDRHTAVISGINGHPEAYYLLTIIMPSGSGTAVLGKEGTKYLLNEGALHHVHYAKNHGMGDVYDYTLIACMLAAAVLIDEPLSVERAACAMLQAGELTGKMRGK